MLLTFFRLYFCPHSWHCKFIAHEVCCLRAQNHNHTRCVTPMRLQKNQNNVRWCHFWLYHNFTCILQTRHGRLKSLNCIAPLWPQCRVLGMVSDSISTGQLGRGAICEIEMACHYDAARHPMGRTEPPTCCCFNCCNAVLCAVFSRQRFRLVTRHQRRAVWKHSWLRERNRRTG